MRIGNDQETDARCLTHRIFAGSENTKAPGANLLAKYQPSKQNYFY